MLTSIPVSALPVTGGLCTSALSGLAIVLLLGKQPLANGAWPVPVRGVGFSKYQHREIINHISSSSAATSSLTISCIRGEYPIAPSSMTQD
jgi:hypothetical protein